MVGPRAALALLAALAAGIAVMSGGSGADPRTPPALPGMPVPFLGTAVVGNGGLTAAIDAYGGVVDMRAPGPAGEALIENPADRQAAGSVSARTGIVPLVRIGGGPARQMWEADSVRQRHLAGTNVVRTVATFRLGARRSGPVKVEITDAARGQELARLVRLKGRPGVKLAPRLSIDVETSGLRGCEQERRGRELALLCSARRGAVEAKATGSAGRQADRIAVGARRLLAAAAADDRRWLGRARPLGAGAPRWAERMYGRSLLTLRALTDRRTGAVAAGARDGWAYVWPRDAGAVGLALAAAGYPAEAHRVARFLVDLDLSAAARFDGTGAPVPGRAAQGDAYGWAIVAARTAGVALPTPPSPGGETALGPWRNRADYQEGAPADYLANAITTADGPQMHLYRGKSARRRGEAEIAAKFAGDGGLVRRAGEPASGVDSAAAWAVRPFPRPALFPMVRKTLLSLTSDRTRFGIAPGESWPSVDPWTAPTAWTAWSLAALGERRKAQRLLTALRRASTPAGALPERVDARTGIPRSTTPLAWSHAFAILALRRFWPL